jgi:hypothetical protein
MSDTPLPERLGGTAGAAFLREALRYARGELGPTEATAFEQRLAHDQAVRDTLCQAVCLLRTEPPLPDPAYREAVARRLWPAGRGGLFGRRLYPGHPLLWGGLGAAAAVLLTLGVGAMSRPAPAPPAAAVAVLARGAKMAHPTCTEMADGCPWFHSGTPAAGLHEEGARCKCRAETHPVKPDVHRAHPLHFCTPRHHEGKCR